MANKNISWVEPNQIYSENRSIIENGVDTNQNIIYETTPPMENYCITVDLEVEVMKRGKGGVVEPAKTILVSWNSPSKEKGSISFFEGKKYTFGDKTINYLTSTPSTFGTFEEVKNEGTNECFGINSIDIQYNSYMVPEVTIEFTDIRGISLFSPEELRHEEINEEGIGGMTNENSNIAGSFFKCFFTFPYPRFKLMVKGFYGEPTSYELTVSDFRTRFDCTTGNFNATAKFVGYSYSLLNDITMNALVVAPLNEYIGASYWKNKNFLFEDGTPMLKLSEVITKVSDLKGHLEQLSKESIEAKTARQLGEEEQKINSVLTSHDEFFYELSKYFSSFKINGDNNPIINNNDRSLVLFLKSENFKEIIVTDDLKSSYNKLKERVISYSNSLDTNLYYGKGEIVFNHLKYDESIETINKICPDFSTKYGNVFKNDSSNNWYVIIYDGSKLNNQIESIKNKNTNAINENSKKISELEKEAIIKALGFNPTVENVTKMIFAHFETLIHTMYNCINLITDRKASDIGLTSTDISDTSSVGPFPRIDIKSINNGIESVEEGWLGDLPGGVNEQEVQLIEGLLKAVNKFQSTAEEASQNLLSSSNTNNYTTTMEIPVIPLDIISKKKIYGENIDFNNISDFIGKVALRMFSVIDLHSDVINEDFLKMGKADAYNFYSQFPSVGKKFLNRLCSSDDVINESVILDCLKNNKEEEKVNGKWAWDSCNDKSKAMMDGSVLSLYDVKNSNNRTTKVLPFTNLNWDKINSTILMGNLPENMDDFISTHYIDKNPCNNIFKIDLNYDYGGFLNKMQVDNEQFSYVNDLNITFNAENYINEFFFDDVRYFSKKLTSINGEVNFNPYEKSHFLPNKRPFTKEETINSKHFKGDNNIDDEFSKITYIINDNNKKDVKRGKSSFKSANSEIGNVTSYTVPFFKGYKYDSWLFNTINTNDRIFTDEWTLFGQKDYYDIPSNEAKGLVFLDSLKLKEEGSNMGGIRFDNYCADGDKNITYHILNKKEPFYVMSYCGILLLGGYFWREREINDKKIEPLGTFIHESKRLKPHAALSYAIDEELFNLRQEIKDYLIKEFESWIENDSFGFKKFQSAFELQSNGSLNQKDFYEQLILHLTDEKDTLETFLWEYANDSIYENYISLKYNNGNIKLYNRESSPAFETFTNFYIKPCMVIKPTKYIKSDIGSYISTNGNDRKYLNGFLTKLKELYKKDYEKSKAEPVFVDPIKTSNHIKISLYKYLKILYDKWLSGTQEKDWTLDNFYEKHWYFLDSFYNKVGDRVMINMVNFCGDILYSQKNNGYSLLSFISKAYAVNRFNLHCVQNFMDLKNEQQDEKFHKMFKAIPYNEIDFQNINFHPAFILMYTYEYSSKLDIKGADFKNDSFNLDDDDDNLPTQITSKRLENGYKIPAFAVTYGKQYQHYFKNIDVSTDNPIVTEEAIKAQFMIASMNSKNNGENGKKISFLGQDLYTIYSNNSYTCTVKMMGCAWIQPLMYFQLNNIPMFRGAYLIQKVFHHIEPGNMETTFVGVRMAKQTTKLVDEAVYGMNNDQTAPQQVRNIIENTLANVSNDCEYAFYNPLVDLENASMPKDDLELTLSEYETKYQSTFNSIVTNKNLTVKQFLANIVAGEASNQDDLGKQLVAVVLFNRYMHFGKNLTKMFWDSQHELGGNGGTSEVNIIVDIFTNSPEVLKGKLTKVHKNIPIYNDGLDSGNKTQPINLTMHMLKSMDGYCTTRGYDVSGKHDVTKEPIGWWHEKAEYLCQHDGGESGNKWGHVFVSGAWKKSQEHWQEISNNVSSSKDSNPSEKSQSFFDAVKKTIKTAFNIDCKEILMEKTDDRNTFFIIAKPEKTMVDIFDAIVNTYYDYFSECNWIVNNDGKENPIKIRIRIEGDTKKDRKNICIAKMKNNIEIDPLNTHEGLNQFFYMTLKKKYGIIDTLNKEVFKVDCTNFNELTTKDSNWVNIANNFLDNKIEPCGGEVNLPIVDGYQWDGDDSIQNKNKPTKRFEKFDKAKAIAHVSYEGSSQGACARYVREAMQEASGEAMNDRPMSACVYSKFMEFWGFTKIYEGFGPSTEGFKPEPGDIAVIAGTKQKKHGHIHIYNGSKWGSDFGANTVYCYRDKGRPYIVYRWIEENVSNA